LKVRAVVAAGALALAGVTGATVLATSAGAQGTMSCPNFTDADVGSVDPGMTGYLVVGTSIDGTTSTLTGTYELNGTPTPFSANGVQNGNGSFHYIFQLPQGAEITAWQVSGATDNTVITVSGCLNGAAVPTTTVGPPVPGGTVTPSGPNVAGENASRPAAAPAAVVGAARFTG
jgi:hypothetical protein